MIGLTLTMDTNGQELLKKYVSGNCTEQEKAIVETWFITHYLDAEPTITTEDREEDMQQVRMRLAQEISIEKPLIRRIIVRIAVAASILFCVGLGFYVYRLNGTHNEVGQDLATNFKAGSNKAILTLSTGKQILLTGNRNGQLALDGNSIITKKANGQLVYHSGDSNTNVAIFNTLSIPRGGKYHLTLADGTDVWLNSASSIKYPTSFNSNIRQVSITGEAYFEVAHLPSKPFRVTCNGQTVEVLGTHFNINAYSNENSVKTTLLEGAVKISVNGVSGILKPAQQAVVSGGKIKFINADTDEAVSWKEGYFDFSGTDLKTVTRQLSRWYDVDFQFAGTFSDETFTGRIPQSWNLGQVVKMLQSTNSFHLTIEGRRIMVKP